MTTAFRLELRRERGIVLAITITAAIYGASMAFFWPVMQQNSELLQQYLSMFPSGFLAAFGMEGSLADAGVFFTTYVGSWLWPILAALVGIVLATRPVAVDLERGFLELPLASQLSRARYLCAVIVAQLLGLALMAFVTIMAFWAAASVVGAPYQLDRMLVLSIQAWLFACAIAAVTALLSVVTLSRTMAGGIVAIGILIMYLLNVIALLQPDLGDIARLSIFHYFRPTPLIDRGEIALFDIGLFALTAAVGWALAIWAFRRRDLAA